LYFRPVEFLEQSSYSSLGAKIECGTITIRNDRDGYTLPRRADEECLRSFAAERNRTCPCRPRNREPADRRLSTFGRITFRGELTKKRARSAEETLDRGSENATGTDGLFSSINPTPRPRFWNTLKRQKVYQGSEEHTSELQSLT